MELGYFDSGAKTFRLWGVAKEWLGTPWAANSASRGPRGGVSCHNLPRAILIEVGHLRADFPEVTGDPNATRHSTDSVIVPFLDSRKEFFRVPLGEKMRAGDLLGIRIYKTVDHLGLYVGSQTFVHVLMHQKTTTDSVVDPTWGERVQAIWRPV